jgi:tetratricopeptide (TPR) repeat protein
MQHAEAHDRESAINWALKASLVGRADSLARDYVRAAGDRSPVPLEDPSLDPWFRARYVAAGAAARAGRLESAAAFLGEIRPDLVRATPELRRRCGLLAAEIATRSGRHAEGRAWLATACHAGEGVPDGGPPGLAELRICLWLGEVGALAEELAACSRDLASRGDLGGLALLECEQARAWAQLGDLGRADSHLERAEDLVARARDGPLHAAILIERGRQAHLRGHYQRALDAYRQAEGLCEPEGVQGQEVRLRSLYVQLELGEADRAQRAFDRLAAGRTPDAFPEELRALARLVGSLLRDDRAVPDGPEAEGFRLASRGEFREARAAYLRALGEAPGPERRARIALALGLLAFELGERPDATARLRQALDEGDALALPEVRWRARQALGRVASEWIGDADAARRYFEEALSLADAQAAELSDPVRRATYRHSRLDASQRLLLGAARRGDAREVFRNQELLRGRLLLELWHGSARRGGRSPSLVGDELERLDRCIDELKVADHDASPDARRQLARLVLERDRLRERLLADRDRAGVAALPRLVELDELRDHLPRGTTYLSASLIGEELVMVAARRDGADRVIREDGAELVEQIEAFRKAVLEQLERYRRGWPMGPEQRARLDGVLEEIGRGPLGRSLASALDGAVQRLIWVPDGPLHGLPLQAVRRDGRYLIEDHELAYGFSGSLFVHQAARPRRSRWRPGLAVVAAGSHDGKLRFTPLEGEGVGAAFYRRRVLDTPESARREAVRRWLPRARVLHLACHAEFSADDPLSACVILPSGERWRADEWADEAVGGLPLVTLSACRSAEVAALAGREVFGLTCGAMSGGVRAVLAGLWSVPDREALDVVWRFYRHLMVYDPCAALARAQRQVLAQPDGSPLYWGLFTLFGDPSALPPSPLWARGWNRWRQRLHERRCRSIVQSFQEAHSR